MYEKILQKLKQQRGQNSNVSDRSLEDLAKSLSTIVTTDEALQKADFSTAINSIDGNINHYTAQQVTKTKEQLKKEEDEKAKKDKEQEEAKKAQQQAAQQEGKTEVPAYITQLMEQNKQIMEQNAKFANELTFLKQEKTSTSRKDKLISVLKGAPEFLTNPILKAFEKTNFENDEDFAAYLHDVKSNKDSYEQAAKEKGLPIDVPRGAKKEEPTGETQALADARKMVQNSKKENK